MERMPQILKKKIKELLRETSLYSIINYIYCNSSTLKQFLIQPLAKARRRSVNRPARRVCLKMKWTSFESFCCLCKWYLPCWESCPHLSTSRCHSRMIELIITCGSRNRHQRSDDTWRVPCFRQREWFCATQLQLSHETLSTHLSALQVSYQLLKRSIMLSTGKISIHEKTPLVSLALVHRKVPCEQRFFPAWILAPKKSFASLVNRERLC